MTSDRILWLRLTLLGMVGGAVAAALVLLFRQSLELGQHLLLPTGLPGDFESLPLLWRLLLPAAVGLLLGIAFDRLRPDDRQIGVVHVLGRLHLLPGWAVHRTPGPGDASNHGGQLRHAGPIAAR